MRYALLLAIFASTTMTVAAEPPMATVAGRKAEKDVSYQGGEGTIGLGMVVAVFGSARLEFAATKERWDAARQRDHIRVQFAKPTILATQLVDPDGKRYVVDEILVRTNPEDVPPAARDPKADWGATDALLARCGDKYYSFAKFEGVLMQPLIKWFGSLPSIKDGVQEGQPSRSLHETRPRSLFSPAQRALAWAGCDPGRAGELSVRPDFTSPFGGRYLAAQHGVRSRAVR